jgi:hypothetical protein
MLVKGKDGCVATATCHEKPSILRTLERLLETKQFQIDHKDAALVSAVRI